MLPTGPPVLRPPRFSDSLSQILLASVLSYNRLFIPPPPGFLVSVILFITKHSLCFEIFPLRFHCRLILVVFLFCFILFLLFFKECVCVCVYNGELEDFSWLTSLEENPWWGGEKLLWNMLVIMEGLLKEVTFKPKPQLE